MPRAAVEEVEPLTVEAENGDRVSVRLGSAAGSMDLAAKPRSVVASRRRSATITNENSGCASVVSCFVYTFCSITMVLANKALASRNQAHIDFLVIAFQSVWAVGLVLICSIAGLIQVGPKLDCSVAVKWFPVNVCFVSMLATGFSSLQYLSVPLVTVFKNLTNVGIMFGEWQLYAQPISCGALFSCIIMVAGAFFAAATDITFTATGYFWMCANCICTAGYVLYMKHATKTIRISKVGMVFYNNLLSIPILLSGALVKGEGRTLVASPLLHDGAYLLLNCYAGCVGFLLNLATLWCVSTNTATTYAVVGALNKVPLAIIGWILFRTEMTSETLSFLSMSMCGGFLYTYAKMREARERGLPR